MFAMAAVETLHTLLLLPTAWGSFPCTTRSTQLQHAFHFHPRDLKFRLVPLPDRKTKDGINRTQCTQDSGWGIHELLTIRLGVARLLHFCTVPCPIESPGVIRDGSAEIFFQSFFFCLRTSRAVSAWAGPFTLLLFPSSISSADCSVAHLSLWRGCCGAWHARTTRVFVSRYLPEGFSEDVWPPLASGRSCSYTYHPLLNVWERSAQSLMIRASTKSGILLSLWWLFVMSFRWA